MMFLFYLSIKVAVQSFRSLEIFLTFAMKKAHKYSNHLTTVNKPYYSCNSNMRTAAQLTLDHQLFCLRDPHHYAKLFIRFLEAAEK